MVELSLKYSILSLVTVSISLWKINLTTRCFSMNEVGNRVSSANGRCFKERWLST